MAVNVSMLRRQPQGATFDPAPVDGALQVPEESPRASVRTAAPRVAPATAASPYAPSAGRADNDASTSLRDAAGVATGTAYGQSQQGYGDWGSAITTAGAFQPTNTMGVANAVNQWDPTGGSGATGAYLDGRAPIGAQGIGDALAGRPTGVAASTGNLSATDFSRIANYDPSAALNQWATGAWNQSRTQLGDDLDAVRARDASAGRLNTGFFDKDRGFVMDRANQGFTNALAGQALNASGQRLSALTSAGQLDLSRAGQMDSLDTNAAMESARLRSAGVGQALDASRLQLQGDQINDDSMYRGATAYDAGQFARGGAANNFDLGKSQFIDSAGQNAAQFAANQSGQRAGLAQQGYQNERDFFGDMVAGRQDREMQRVAMDRANSTNKANSILNGVGTVVKGISAFFGKGN